MVAFHRVLKCDVIKFSFLHFSIFMTIFAAISQAPMNRLPPNLAVDVFHHAPPIHGIQNAEMQKKVFCDVIASVEILTALSLLGTGA